MERLQPIDLLSRGTEDIYSQDELKAMLDWERPLRIKLGLDPTAPDLHLGHAVQLKKLRQFQDLGHTAVLVIGDYTARIGDPSGRDTTRPILTDATIKQNAQTYLDQAGKVLDTASDKLEIRWNSHWLAKLNFADVLRLTGMITVQQMLHRDSFKSRMKNNTEIVLSEFMYPLMQGYDSVMIKADVEMGGTDQTFNCLTARELMARFDVPRQVVLIMPLLVGVDGHEKMSKTKNNAIALTEPPGEIFGKIMSIPDDVMSTYFRLCTDLPEHRIFSMLDSEQTHPREAKDALGRIIVEALYGRSDAQTVSAEFRRQFTDRQLPSEIPTHRVSRSPIRILELITHVGFASSRGDARRLIQQGAVTFADQKVSDPTAEVDINDEPILKVGKRRICTVVLDLNGTA